MAVSRRPLRGITEPLIFDMRRLPAKSRPFQLADTPELRPGEEDSHTTLLVGEMVTAYLDNGISITLTHTGEGPEPYRVVVLRTGRQIEPGARTFEDEPDARMFARRITRDRFEGRSITTEVRRQSGRTYKTVTYPQQSETA